jgi:heptosyltransferase III
VIRGSGLLRKWDKYLGIVALPIARRLLCWRRGDKEKKSLLIIMIAPIGDTVLLGRVIQSFQKSHPNILITCILSKSSQQVLDILGIKRKDLLIDKKTTLLKTLINSKFDTIIDTHQWARGTAFLTCLPKANLRAGFDTLGQYRKSVFDCSIVHSNKKHEIENYTTLFQRLYLFEMLDNVNIYCSLDSIYSDPYVVIHPWASGFRHEMREWPIDHWNMLTNYFIDKGINVVFTGSSKDQIREKKLEKKEGVFFKAGNFSLKQMISLLSSSKGLVTVNSGIMHLSTLVNIPIVALHGPTNPLRWGPLSDKNYCLFPKSGPKGYLNLGFEYPENVSYNMHTIDVKDVENACHKMLVDF